MIFIVHEPGRRGTTAVALLLELLASPACPAREVSTVSRPAKKDLLVHPLDDEIGEVHVLHGQLDLGLFSSAWRRSSLFPARKKKKKAEVEPPATARALRTSSSIRRRR